METDTPLQRWLAAAACALLPMRASAFEPGRERICEPSADGRRFECHDKATGAADPVTDRVDRIPRNPPSAPAHMSHPAEPDRPAAMAESARAASLPNYLRSTPARDIDQSETVPAHAASTQVSAAAEPAAAARPSSAVDVSAAEAQPSAEPVRTAEAPIEPPLIEAVTETVSAQHDEPPPPAPIEAMPAPSAATGPALADAQAFRRLDARRYTLELAHAVRREALLAIADASGLLDGTLYLVALRTPDGTTWRLFWSDFADVDAARAARARLPAGFTGNAVWPRRVGPLQTELISP